ncbi:MAG: LuxR C-terminal-related transcriptional regulator [Bacteroidota bacterium]
MQGRNLKNRHIFFYSAALALGLCLLKWLESRFLIIGHSFEIYAGGIALIFTMLGIWLALHLTKPKIETITIEREVIREAPTGHGLPKDALLSLGISSRELEVLLLMADGLSNQEIADRLFVSLNTIKTHSSRIFEKLEVKRRTQAVEKARSLSR